jgi:hypothetical protein
MNALVKVLLLFCVLTTSALSAPTLPSVTLKDGTVLNSVTIISAGERVVMAKWQGGRGTIPIADLPADIQKAIEPMRLGAVALSSSTPKPVRIVIPTPVVAPSRPATRKITGQVFVATSGSGAYKFAGALVRAYRKSEAESARLMIDSYLPLNYRRLDWFQRAGAIGAAWVKAVDSLNPVGSTRTDAEGVFSLEIPAEGEFALVCTTSRALSEFVTTYNTWVVDVGSGDRVDLNNANIVSFD